ncbi:hypothetical protein ScPMuIL_014459 [Solemya velum]
MPGFDVEFQNQNCIHTPIESPLHHCGSLYIIGAREKQGFWQIADNADILLFQLLSRASVQCILRENSFEWEIQRLWGVSPRFSAH